jgi:hypothetical protein
VAKAPAPNAPTTASAFYGQTLADIAAQLPDGWAWFEATTTAVGNAPGAVHAAKYEGTEVYAEGLVMVTVTIASAAKATQSIAFVPAAALNVGDGSYVLEATATSGLPVLFRLAATEAATLKSNVLLLQHGGNVTVTAYVAPDSSYEAAPEVSVTIALQPDFVTYAVVRPSGSLMMNMVRLAADGYSVATYRWYKNGEQVGNSGETVAGILTVGATYRFELETADGEVLSSTTYTYSISTAVGAASAVALHVYPNPATGGQLAIFNEQWEAGDKVEVYNLLGAVVGTYDVAGETTVINVSHLPSGVYFARMGNRIAKVIINN